MAQLLHHRWQLLLSMTMLGLHLQTVLYAQTRCGPLTPILPQATTSAGRPQLAQGIALYEKRDWDQAERALQAALFAGLADTMERASAHKYLAYIYCSKKEQGRCESAFDAAFAAHPGFALQGYEITGTPWREIYARVQERWLRDCGAVIQRQSTQAFNGSFALNSRVVTFIEPLKLGSTSVITFAKRHEPPKTDHNLRLKVSPWAYIRINGKPSGVTPPIVLLKLAPGIHTVELLNPGFDPYQQVIQLTDGQSVILSHDFDAR